MLTTATDGALPAHQTIDGVEVSGLCGCGKPSGRRGARSADAARELLRLVPGTDAVHLQGFSRKNILIVAIAKSFGRPTVLSLQTAGHDEPQTVRPGTPAAWAFGSHDMFLSVSAPLRRTCARDCRRIGFVSCRTVSTSNDSCLRRSDVRATLRRRLGLPLDRPIVLFVGMFSRDKQPRILFDAWLGLSARPVVGLDPALCRRHTVAVLRDRSIAARARHARGCRGSWRCRPARVRGPDSQVRDYFRAADLFSLPSAREGLPIACSRRWRPGWRASRRDCRGRPTRCRGGRERPARAVWRRERACVGADRLPPQLRRWACGGHTRARETSCSVMASVARRRRGRVMRCDVLRDRHPCAHRRRGRSRRTSSAFRRSTGTSSGRGTRKSCRRWRRTATACCSSRTPASARRACAICRACASACGTGGGARRDSARSGRTCSSTRRSCCRCRTRASPGGSTGSLLLRALRRWMRAIGFNRPIVWTFLPTPLALDLIDELDPPLTIYYCIDDFASSSPGARRIVGERGALFRRRRSRVRHVRDSCASARARSATRVHLFPFGVKLRAVRRACARRRGARPSDIAALQRPIVGYVGGLHQWVDQDCSSRRRGDGCPTRRSRSSDRRRPTSSRLEALRQRARCSAQRPHDELPRYVQGVRRRHRAVPAERSTPPTSIRRS